MQNFCSVRSAYLSESRAGLADKLERAACLVIFYACSQNCEKHLLASSCLSFRSFSPREIIRLPQERFSWNLILEDFCEKSVEKIQISIKTEKNNGYFAWRSMYIYISLNYSYNEKCFWQQSWRKPKYILYPSYIFFRKYRRLWDNVEKYRRARHVTDDNIIRRMHFACWITKATETPRICNNYYLSKARMVMRTRFSVT